MSSRTAVDAAALAVGHLIIYLGFDVHKDSITIAVLPAGATTPTRVDRLPSDLPTLERMARAHSQLVRWKCLQKWSKYPRQLQRSVR